MYRLILRGIVTVIALFLLLPLHCGWAQEESRNGTAAEWTAGVGLSGIVKPSYEGSDEYVVKGFPLVDIRWRDLIFFSTREGLGVNLWNRQGMTLGLSLGWRFGRDEDDSADLRGLGDIDSGAAMNVFGRWRVHDVSFGIRVSTQITGDDTGYLVDCDLRYHSEATKSLSVQPSIAASYAGSDYMEHYFGISAAQSASSGLPAYTAHSGIKSIGPRILVLYRLSQNWRFSGSVNYTRLVGDAEDSPVVKEKDQFGAILGFSYNY